MKRTLIFLSLLAAVLLPLSSWAQQASDTGNAIGHVDSLTCSGASGWSLDPDFVPPMISGCTDVSATNYNQDATVDDGSCKYPTAACVSRYRWVNAGSSGTKDAAATCSAVGAVPMTTNISGRGFCASGEDRPTSGYDVSTIIYSRGVWGGGNGSGGTQMGMQNGGYRCYLPGQKQDKDNTDVAIAYYCDFGSSYPESCPGDYPPARTYSGSGGGGGCFTSSTLITLSDGSEKPVSSLSVGDMVKGETSDNKVLGVKKVLLGDRPLYSINGKEAFVTAGHPFKTEAGWKSIDPNETSREGVDLAVSKLAIGDRLLVSGGVEEVVSIEPRGGAAGQVLYNPMLDGDHTYFADGYLVHNKLQRDNRYLLNLRPGQLLKAIATLFKPLALNAASSDSNTVLIYDGPIDSGTFVAEVSANQYRADVNAVVGVSGNHGFSWSLPTSLSNGAEHTLYFYGTDVDVAGKSNELSGSPKSITCQPRQNSAPSAPSLSCPTGDVTTNSQASIAFTSNDQDGDTIRYLIDWDSNGSVNQYVPAGGAYVSSGTQQSASKSWATAGLKTVSVSTEDSLGAVSSAATCNISVVEGGITAPQCSDGTDNDGDGKIDHPEDPGCTSANDGDESDTTTVTTPQCSDGADNDADGKTDYPQDLGCTDSNDDTENSDAPPQCTVNCGGDNGGGGNGGNGGNNQNQAGYTVTGAPKLKIQFLSNLPATSETSRISINPVNGFNSPVTLRVTSIMSSTGASLPSTVTPTYYFDGTEASTATMTYSSSFGEYVNQSGTIGIPFAVKLSSKIDNPYFVTIVGESGARSAQYVVELDPRGVNPDFREI